MTLGDLLSELAAKGVFATERKVHRAITWRKVDRPDKDSRGGYIYTEHNLEQIVALFKGDRNGKK